MGGKEAGMKSILFLAHRIPYPPNKGDKIRSYHLLKYLSQKYNVYLGAFVDDKQDWQYVEHLQKYTENQLILPRKNHYNAMLNYANAFMQHKPLSNAMYQSTKMQDWVDQLIQTQKVDSVLVFSSSMAQYIQSSHKIQTIVDFVDVDSLKWEQYSQQYYGLKRWIYRREGRTLAKLEKQIAQKIQLSVFVTESEANYFKSRTKLSNNIISLGNGVDTDYFNPIHDLEDPFPPSNHCKIVFTGMMDYWPNVDAVTWFVDTVVSHLRKQGLRFEFYIVGGNPCRAIQKLHNSNDIFVTGRVADIRPYLKFSDFAVAPLRIARGIQNKVLEALSMDCPIIVSPEALEGIVLPNTRNLSTATNKQSWCQQVNEHIKQFGQRHYESHELIKNNYSWQAALSGLDAYI